MGEGGKGEEELSRLDPAVDFPVEPFPVLDSAPDRFPVDHLRRSGLYPDAEFTGKAVDKDLQVEFPHPGQDGLARFPVLAHPERRVFPLELFQGGEEFFPVIHTSWLHRQRDHRFRHAQPFEYDRAGVIAEGVAGERLLESGDGDDIAGGCQGEPLPLVGMHPEEL